MKVLFYVIFSSVHFTAIYSLLIKQMLDDFVDNQLYFGFKDSFNTTRKDCVWRDVAKHRHLCAQEVTMELFSNGRRETIDTTDKLWLNKSTIWDRERENVFFVHGYAGGDNAPPKLILQDALAQSGRYNTFALEYGVVSRAPCFVQVVYNVNYVSYCIASAINAFVRIGMPAKSVICVGHSIGAQICSRMKHTLRFRMKKIIGLDPALPLIKESERLSYRDADSVHTLSTNAGFYGDITGTMGLGHVDVCANNGHIQPFCVGELNENLCSHLWSLCFTAQSLFSNYQLYAKKCQRVCPHYNVIEYASKLTQFERPIAHSSVQTWNQPESIAWGFDIPKSVRGSYCLTAETPPFCPKYLNGFGTERCCSLVKMFT